MQLDRGDVREGMDDQRVLLDWWKRLLEGLDDPVELAEFVGERVVVLESEA